MSVLRLEPWSWPTWGSAASMSSIRWISMIRLRSTRWWNSRLYLSPRLALRLPSMLEHLFWQPPILSTVDTIPTKLHKRTLTFQLLSCQDLTLFLSCLITRVLRKIFSWLGILPRFIRTRMLQLNQTTSTLSLSKTISLCQKTTNLRSVRSWQLFSLKSMSRDVPFMLILQSKVSATLPPETSWHWSACVKQE